MLPPSGAAQYYVEDMLGSSRVVTTNTGVVCYDADFYPYGGESAITNNCPAANKYKFEGKERDDESGNDDFGARYYSWRFGRWLSADWSAVPAPVPYANFTNPQTLNLYAMVHDDPETFADLDGHDDWIYGVLYGIRGSQDGTLQSTLNALEESAQNTLQVTPVESHLVPTPKGTDCNQDGVICEQNGKRVRVGDYNGDTFCNAKGCFVWRGDSKGNGHWVPLPAWDVRRCPKGDCPIQPVLGPIIFVSAAVASVAEIGAASAGGATTVLFGHGARHLAESGLGQAAVESAIRADILQALANGATSGSFWGRVVVAGQTIFYRAFTLPDGTISVGTYTVGAP